MRWVASGAGWTSRSGQRTAPSSCSPGPRATCWCAGVAAAMEGMGCPRGPCARGAASGAHAAGPTRAGALDARATATLVVVQDVNPETAFIPPAAGGIRIPRQPGKLHADMHAYLARCGVAGVKVDVQVGAAFVQRGWAGDDLPF